MVDSPQFAAFYAKLYNKVDYGNGAVFTLSSKDGKDLQEAESVRVFHGFGNENINFKCKTYKVSKEKTIKP